MDYQIGIIGAGFAGLVAALRLKKSGRNSFIIFERASEVGGTWRDNIYPGCACDVASPLYCFAGEPNTKWSRLYSSQPEILNYIKDIVQNNGLDKYIQYNTEIIDAYFHKESGTWTLTDTMGSNVKVGMLILGTGPLNRPDIPNFPGLSEFKGKQFHSSQWDNNYDLTGKKVAVIGTGASAIQIIPSIVPMVKQLFVFQRTPAWVTPRLDKALTEEQHQRWKKYPVLMKWEREKLYWLNEFLGLGFIGKERVNKTMLKYALRRLEKQVKDPEIRKKLTPNYKIGCKRILKSDDYYPVFNQKHVTLITNPIKKFVPEGVVAGDNTYQLDSVILATGFIAADMYLKIRIIGINGESLIDKWKVTGAEAYLGTTISGFPNLAFILGPNTGLGHNSVIHMMESQMNYVMQYIHYLEKAGNGSYLDVYADIQKKYNEDLQGKFKGTVWSSGCKSWYLNAAGKNTTLFPRLTGYFRKRTKRFEISDYHLVRKSVKMPKLAEVS